jgi:hypothetical protein
MSQVGTVVSCGPWNRGIPAANTSDVTDYSVDFVYQLDLGGVQTGRVYVGNGPNANVGWWASPTSMITVPLSLTPGTTSQVSLPCPALAAAGIFGAALK